MTLGSLFLVFEGIGRGLEFLCFWGPPLGDPRLREDGQDKVNALPWGQVNSLQTPACQLLDS